MHEVSLAHSEAAVIRVVILRLLLETEVPVAAKDDMINVSGVFSAMSVRDPEECEESKKSRNLLQMVRSHGLPVAREV